MNKAFDALFQKLSSVELNGQNCKKLFSFVVVCVYLFNFLLSVKISEFRYLFVCTHFWNNVFDANTFWAECLDVIESYLDWFEVGWKYVEAFVLNRIYSTEQAVSQARRISTTLTGIITNQYTCHCDCANERSEKRILKQNS